MLAPYRSCFANTTLRLSRLSRLKIMCLYRVHVFLPPSFLKLPIFMTFANRNLGLSQVRTHDLLQLLIARSFLLVLVGDVLVWSNGWGRACSGFSTVCSGSTLSASLRSLAAIFSLHSTRTRPRSVIRIIRNEHFTTNIVSHRKRFISLNFFAPVRKISECFRRQQTKITLIE